MKINQSNDTMLRQKLYALRQEHRELDLAIQALSIKISSASIGSNDDHEFEISRLKKQKLKLKDTIQDIQNRLIPDLHA